MKRNNARRTSPVPHLALFVTISLLAIAHSNGAAAVLNGTIETYVGGGNGDGDTAINATIDPRGIALVGSASAPDVYVADYKNNRVRRVDGSTGLIETVAGDGNAAFGGDGGQGQNASLRSPLDVAVDSAGNVYIADTNNNRIRKVGTDGRISTIAGNGQPTYDGEGTATQHGLNNPYGVAIGPDGNVYVADFGNNRIRKISPPGCAPSSCTISTAVGSGTWGFSDGPAGNAALRNPSDVTFDSAGTMYIADFNNQRIRRVANGSVTTVAGGGAVGAGGTIGDGGPGTSAVLNYPVQVSTDTSGNIYIADSSYNRIRMLQAGNFFISTVAGTGNSGSGGDGGPPTRADMYAPWGVGATTPGTFWLSQTTQLPVSQQNRVRKVTNSQVIQSVIGGGLGDGGAALNALVDPRGGEAVDAGGVLPDLYFADGSNNVVRRVDGDTGIIDIVAGTGVAGYSGDNGNALNAKLNTPLDVAVDAASGIVYVADYWNNVIRKISNGTITTVAGNGQWGDIGDGPATQRSLAHPTGVDVDRFGNLYIADFDNNRIRKVTGGQMTTVAGNGSWGYSGDNGAPTSAMLRNPWDVAVMDDGTMYISDSGSARVRRVSTAGVITTYAGNGSSGFSGDLGLATLAKITVPTFLSGDSVGNLYIADSQNNRVRRVDAVALTIQTVAGNGLTGYSGDGGAATSASLGEATGVAISRSGNPLFISTKDVGRVRSVDFGTSQPPATATFTFTATPIPPSPTLPPTATRTPVVVATATRTWTATRTNTAAPANVSVSGKISYYSNSQISVPGADVDLTGPTSQTVRTSSSGNYSITSMPTGTWQVEPVKIGAFGNAVSSLDAARVLQVIAGITTFTPMQRLACDVTGDGSLSALDAVRILQFSAGVITQLPLAQACGSDWLFSPSPDQMQNQTITPPLISGGSCQPGNIVIAPLLVPATNQDFDAILIGDCTGNWTPAAAGAALRQLASSAAGTTVRAGALRHGPGHRLLLPIYVRAQAPFHALDLRVVYDASALTLQSVHTHGSASAAMIGVSGSRPGVVGVSLASAEPIDAAAGAVVLVEFTGADAAPPQILHAQIDEQPARVVSVGTP